MKFILTQTSSKLKLALTRTFMFAFDSGTRVARLVFKTITRLDLEIAKNCNMFQTIECACYGIENMFDPVPHLFNEKKND